MNRLLPISAMLVLFSPAAWADGRSVAYLQGVAFGIAANCPSLPLDAKAIALAKKGIEGIRQGTASDFAVGAFQFHSLLNDGSNGECRDDGPCTCENVCNFRPGTCYFIKEKDK